MNSCPHKHNVSCFVCDICVLTESSSVCTFY